MPLSQVEEYLRHSGKPTEWHNKALVIRPKKNDPFLVRFVEERHGWVKGQVYVSLGKSAKEITRVDQFLIEVEKRLGTGVQIGFQPKGNIFSIQRILVDDDLLLEIEGLLLVNNHLFPLFLRVGETGRWDKDLISLAFTSPEFLPQA